MIQPDCSHLWPVAARLSPPQPELIALQRAFSLSADQPAIAIPVAIKILS